MDDKMENTMQRTFTQVGKDAGYTKGSIENSIEKVKWVKFTPDNLPYSQGTVLNAVINQCNVPASKISRMDLHGSIKGTHGFYALDVKYKNGQVQVFIADNGCSSCIVASDFLEN